MPTADTTTLFVARLSKPKDTIITLVGKLPYDVNKTLTCLIIEGNDFSQFLLQKN